MVIFDRHVSNVSMLIYRVTGELHFMPDFPKAHLGTGPRWTCDLEVNRSPGANN